MESGTEASSGCVRDHVRHHLRHGSSKGPSKCGFNGGDGVQYGLGRRLRTNSNSQIGPIISGADNRRNGKLDSGTSLLRRGTKAVVYGYHVLLLLWHFNFS